MKRKNHLWREVAQILLMLGIIGASGMLLWDWKKYEICFSIVFGLAIVLFFSMGIGAAVGDRRKPQMGAAVVYFVLTALMIGFFTGSVLVIWKL